MQLPRRSRSAYELVGSLILLLLFAKLATAKVDYRERVMFWGASETSGIGLKLRQTYPALVAQRCGVAVTVEAHPFRPVLLARSASPPHHISAFVLFIGPADIMGVRASAGELAKWLRLTVGANPTILLLAPDFHRIPNFSKNIDAERAQKRLYENVGHLGIRNVATLQLRMTLPNLLQQDGIHPNAAGEAEIFRQLLPWLRAQRICF